MPNGITNEVSLTAAGIRVCDVRQDGSNAALDDESRVATGRDALSASRLDGHGGDDVVADTAVLDQRADRKGRRQEVAGVRHEPEFRPIRGIGQEADAGSA